MEEAQAATLGQTGVRLGHERDSGMWPTPLGSWAKRGEGARLREGGREKEGSRPKRGENSFSIYELRNLGSGQKEIEKKLLQIYALQNSNNSSTRLTQEPRHSPTNNSICMRCFVSGLDLGLT